MESPLSPRPLRLAAASVLGPRTRDNLGLCLFRRCTTADDCPLPLRCLARPLAGTTVCTFPNPGE